MLDAPFGDVLNGLENARQAAWAERSPLNRAGMCTNQGHRGSSSHGSLPNSHSQPIYVPGKYSVSARAEEKVENVFCRVDDELLRGSEKVQFFVWTDHSATVISSGVNK